MLNAALFIIWLCLIIYLIKRVAFFASSGLRPHQLFMLLGLKMAIAVVLCFIYTYYYPDRSKADIFKYFDDATVLFQQAASHPFYFWQCILGEPQHSALTNALLDKMNNWNHHAEIQLFKDSHFLIKLNAVLMFITNGFYPIHCMLFTFLGFTGLVGFYRVFNRSFSNFKTLNLLLVFFTPSILLWTSGILKETTVFFFMGLGLYTFSKPQKSPKDYAMLFALACGIWLSKPMVLYLLILPIILLLKPLQTHIWTKNYRILLALITCLTITYMSLFAPFSNFYAVLVQKQHEFFLLSKISNTNVNIPALDGSILHFFGGCLWALKNSLLAPILPRHGFFIALAAFENWMLLIFMAGTAFVFYYKPEQNYRIFAASLLFSISWLIIIGITTPVIGAIVRYRIPALPLLYFGLLSLIYPQNENSNTIS